MLRRVLLSTDFYECLVSMTSGCKWIQKTAGIVYIIARFDYCCPFMRPWLKAGRQEQVALYMFSFFTRSGNQCWTGIDRHRRHCCMTVLLSIATPGPRFRSYDICLQGSTCMMTISDLAMRRVGRRYIRLTLHGFFRRLY